jgi:phospholipid/cholesterol/gamma-HCH transport system substrate-binding protein
MTDTLKNILIGLFVLAASAIVVFVILFLHPTVGDEGLTLRVRFANVDKISVGTRVTYGGKPVGEVTEIREIETLKDPRKPGKDGFVYLYELILAVDSSVRVYNTDKIVARTSGLLGEKSVDITPLAAKPGEKVWLVNDQILYATETGSVEETLLEFKELADGIQEVTTSFNETLLELKEEKFWKRLGTIADNLSDITTALNKPGKWESTLSQIEIFSRHINIVAENANRVLENANSGISQINRAATHVAAIAENTRGGQGTLGRILMKEDLYLQVTALLNKAEVILDDINHFGILFQNDKRWQRLRARRANLITRLCTPQEFRNYFNAELDEITTALARLSMVIGETECECCPCFMEDEEFRKVFAELLRRVSAMEESLKLYNQQVIDCDVYQTELIPE